MKHHNIFITIICEVHKTNFCPPYVKKFVNFHVGYAVIILWSTLWKMTVTQKHIAPLHPRFPTWDENCFCRTTLERWGLKRWGFKTSGCKNVSFNQIPHDAFVGRKKKAFPLYSWVHVRVSDFFFYAIGEGDTIHPSPWRNWHVALTVPSSLSVFPLNFCKLVRLPLRNNRT